MNVVNFQRLLQTLILVGIAAHVLLYFYYQSVTQVTSTPSVTKLEDIFISVKTSQKFHKSRLPVIIKTWFQIAKDQTWFITDGKDLELLKETNGHMVITNCEPTHSATGLCCKLSAEFDTYIKSGKKWFCHMDDDIYLNVPRLVHVLNDYNPQKEWYLGKRSVNHSTKGIDKATLRNFSYRFAHGGAGFCLSRALALKMRPVVGGGEFVNICMRLDRPDDVTMGYVVVHLMKTPLTEILEFRSHRELLKSVQQYAFHEQITFSYKKNNTVEIGGFDKHKDKTRFLSIHCFLFPQFDFCPKQWQRISLALSNIVVLEQSCQSLSAALRVMYVPNVPNVNCVKLQRLLQALMLVGIAAYMMLYFYYQSVTQGTSTPSVTKLEDVFISVKTSQKFHKSRLPVIIKTWFQLAKEQTWFITDLADWKLQARTNGHMVVTNCARQYTKAEICCKLSAAFDTYIKSRKKWFCHMDDDIYLNVPRLVHVLNDYSPQEEWYLGRLLQINPIHLFDKDNLEDASFRFAHGGAGFCLSRALALEMQPVVGGGEFANICEKIGRKDDITMGYVVEYLMKTPLTQILAFHSHIETMKYIPQTAFHEQITFSYDRGNVVEISGFDQQIDATRFLSIHCFLFPHVDFCPKQWQRVTFIQQMS